MVNSSSLSAYGATSQLRSPWWLPDLQILFEAGEGLGNVCDLVIPARPFSPPPHQGAGAERSCLKAAKYPPEGSHD